MKRLLLLLLCAIAFFGTKAQTKTNVSNNQSDLNLLAANLKANPENPLNVNKQVLVDVANALPEGNLKAKLLSYSHDLGSDADLSMRQIYWDMNLAFTKNQQLMSMPNMGKFGKGLSILMDNPDQLISSIKDKMANYSTGVFLNDPEIMGKLRQVTKSDAAAQGVGLGAEFAATFIADAKQAKAFKSDYKTYAEISNQMIYLEIDKNLRKALIDACVGKNPFSTITPIYRYDFDNGAVITAENGILKYINVSKNITIDWFAIESRNNGKTKDGSSWRAEFNDGKDPRNKTYPHPQFIMTSDDEKHAFITSGDIETENNCANCLTKNLFETVNLDDGSLTNKPEYKYLDFSYLLGSPLIKTMGPTAESLKLYMKTLKPVDLKLEEQVIPRQSAVMRPDQQFRYPAGDRDLQPIGGIGVNTAHKGGLISQKTPFSITLAWDMKKKGESILSSSVFDVCKFVPPTTSMEKGKVKYIDNSQYSSRAENTITGAITAKNGNLYYVTSGGNIGKIDLNVTPADDPGLLSKMKDAEVNAGLIPYNFTNNQKFLFESATFTNYYSLPSLTLTPDEKHLVYIIGSTFYLINVNDLTDRKKFTMTIEPYNCYFAKENGEPTIYFQAFNDFKFPVTKKYSLNKLINAAMEEVKVVSKPAIPGINAAEAKTANSSVADEIKKLRALLNDGSITQAEYDKAKKMILDKK